MNVFIQAAQTLVSHLRAQGIASVAQDDIVIIDIVTRQQEIRIGVGYGPECIDVNDLRSARPDCIQRALEAVKRITGLPMETSGSYRKIDAKRAGIGANFEDIIFRSKIFSKCPNPSSSDLAAWRPYVKRIAQHVFYKFRAPLLAFGYDADDMESLGLVHLTTALHRYRSGEPERDRAVIGRYVTQRLTEVVRKVQRKGKRCTASHEVRSFIEVREG
jgi:hypothetical protein